MTILIIESQKSADPMQESKTKNRTGFCTYPAQIYGEDKIVFFDRGNYLQWSLRQMQYKTYRETIPTKTNASYWNVLLKEDRPCKIEQKIHR